MVAFATGYPQWVGEQWPGDNVHPAFFFCPMLVAANATNFVLKETPTPITPVGPKAGSAKGEIWMSDDFDEPLEDFADYM